MTAPNQRLVEAVAEATYSKRIERMGVDHPRLGLRSLRYAKLPEVQKKVERDIARTALAACHADELVSALRAMRREYGANMTVCGKTLVAVDNLLAKLDGR